MALLGRAAAAGAVAEVAASEYGRVLASVIGTVSDWAIAEDAVQDALARALDRWSRDGVPRNPAAWLIMVGRNIGIDGARRLLVSASNVNNALDPLAALADITVKIPEPDWRSC